MTRLAGLLHAENSGGIYGHPDHLAVHRLGRAAARLAGITGYEATIDRDRLPTVGRHLVEGDQPRSLRATLGRSADQISTVIQATVEELQAKRNAMAAHPSQIPTSAVDTPDFPTTYGTEWFTSVGPPGILDLISGDPAPPRSALEVDHLLGTTAASLQTADASY